MNNTKSTMQLDFEGNLIETDERKLCGSEWPIIGFFSPANDSTILTMHLFNPEKL